MLDLDLAYPFTLGLVAAFNPCGFAMLPVYVSFFLGNKGEDDTSTARSLLRALKVGASLTVGFVAVFGSFGLVTSLLVSSASILEYTPYVTVGIGVGLVPVGIAMVFFGFEPKISTPRLERGGDSGEIVSMFLFGVSYAVVSLGCTIGLFLLGVSNVFTSDDFVDGVAVFLAYGLGMGAVIMTLTIAMALAVTSIATNMRKILPWINRISGVLLALSGAYLVVYGWWEVQVLRGNLVENRLVRFFEDIQTEVNVWIDETSATRLGTAMLLIVAAALLRGVWAELDRRVALGCVAGLGVVWLLVEFVKPWNGERPNLFVLPLIRTLISVPSRLSNWFSDPLRWGTLGELLVIAVGGLAVWFVARRRLGSEPAAEAELVGQSTE